MAIQVLNDNVLMEEQRTKINANFAELDAVMGTWSSFTPSVYGATTTGNATTRFEVCNYKFIDDTCIYNFGFQVTNWATSGMSGRVTMSLPVPSVGTANVTIVFAGPLPTNMVSVAVDSAGRFSYSGNSALGDLTANLITNNEFNIRGTLIYRYQ